MKIIKTSTVLANFEGKPLKNGTKDWTVGDAVSFVLGGRVSNPTLGWILGKKFATQKQVELRAEDVVFIKKEVEENKELFAVLAGQLIEILDGKESKEK